MKDIAIEGDRGTRRRGQAWRGTRRTHRRAGSPFPDLMGRSESLPARLWPICWRTLMSTQQRGTARARLPRRGSPITEQETDRTSGLRELYSQDPLDLNIVRRHDALSMIRPSHRPAPSGRCRSRSVTAARPAATYRATPRRSPCRPGWTALARGW
jgi:hypothetical protein